MDVTPFGIGQRFLGVTEVAGTSSNPLILAMLKLDANWVEDDDVPWCSAWLNFVCWLLELPRSRSLAARSWLMVGRSISLTDAQIGFDVVVLTRGVGAQPGPNTLNAPGHVGWFAGMDDTHVLLLGGNQGDRVSIAAFPKTRILGIRRLRG